jgi:hypothetical protein
MHTSEVCRRLILLVDINVSGAHVTFIFRTEELSLITISFPFCGENQHCSLENSLSLPIDHILDPIPYLKQFRSEYGGSTFLRNVGIRL